MERANCQSKNRDYLYYNLDITDIPGGGQNPLTFLGFLLTPGNFRIESFTPRETPQNCVTPLKKF